MIISSDGRSVQGMMKWKFREYNPSFGLKLKNTAKCFGSYCSLFMATILIFDLPVTTLMPVSAFSSLSVPPRFSVKGYTTTQVPVTFFDTDTEVEDGIASQHKDRAKWTDINYFSFSIEEQERQVFELINQKRIKHGQRPFFRDNCLDYIALKGAELLVGASSNNGTAGGSSSLSHTLKERVKESRYENIQPPEEWLKDGGGYSFYYGELYQTGAPSVMDLLKNPKHAASLLGPDFDEIGVRIAKKNQVIGQTSQSASKSSSYHMNNDSDPLNIVLVVTLASIRLTQSRDAATSSDTTNVPSTDNPSGDFSSFAVAQGGNFGVTFVHDTHATTHSAEQNSNGVQWSKRRSAINPFPSNSIHLQTMKHTHPVHQRHQYKQHHHGHRHDRSGSTEETEGDVDHIQEKTTSTTKTTRTVRETASFLTPENDQRSLMTEEELQLSNRVFDLTNEERKKHNLPRLTRNRLLDQAAYHHAVDMYQRDYFAHVSPEGVTYDQRIERTGYLRFETFGRVGWKCRTATGENLAAGQLSPEEAVQDWMNSPTHRDNILSKEFMELGVGVYDDHWVQSFGTVDLKFSE